MPHPSLPHECTFLAKRRSPVGSHSIGALKNTQIQESTSSTRIPSPPLISSDTRRSTTLDWRAERPPLNFPPRRLKCSTVCERGIPSRLPKHCFSTSLYHIYCDFVPRSCPGGQKSQIYAAYLLARSIPPLDFGVLDFGALDCWLREIAGLLAHDCVSETLSLLAHIRWPGLSHPLTGGRRASGAGLLDAGMAGLLADDCVN